MRRIPKERPLVEEIRYTVSKTAMFNSLKKGRILQARRQITGPIHFLRYRTYFELWTEESWKTMHYIQKIDSLLLFLGYLSRHSTELYKIGEYQWMTQEEFDETILDRISLL